MKPLLPVALAPQCWRRAAGLPLVAVVALAAPGAGPAVAQSAEDWSTAPLTLPAEPGGAPARAPDASVPPPRPILQPPPELRRPQAPLQPGEAPPSAPRPLPSVRVIPGTGVRPTPARAPAAVAPAPASRVPAQPARPAPARPAPAPSARPAPVPPTSSLSPVPSAADLQRIRASLRQSRLAMPKPAVPNYLESLPPGTLRPLPGEVLPGSRPPGRTPLPPGAAPSPLQGMPPPPLPPQAVPPPPWLGGKKEPPRRDSPWAWLLLGLGLGGTGVFLLQERRRPMAGVGPLDALGIRVVPRPDPGTQTLRPLGSAGASQGE